MWAWDEDQAICDDSDHKWGDGLKAVGQGGQNDFSSSTLKQDGRPEGGRKRTLTENAKELQRDTPVSSGQFCLRCNAWRGSLGLEPTPELFIQHIVQIFREVRRVLRKDGVVFINLGDSYTSGNRPDRDPAPVSGSGLKNRSAGLDRPKVPAGLKAKDLCMIPARVALALQADGWWLRSMMPWVKRSSMPESVTDRPASALEYVFLLSKSEKYFFDNDAIRQPHKTPVDLQIKRINAAKKTQTDRIKDSDSGTDALEKWSIKKAEQDMINPADRNFRNTDLFFQSIDPPHGMIFAGDELIGLDVNPQAFSEAHFATFPFKLVEPLILAGTSEKGCCPECGAPWVRVVEEGEVTSKGGAAKHDIAINRNKQRTSITAHESKTIGWKPSCECEKLITLHHGPKALAYKTIPCTILDPFGGSGTTALGAHKHRRKAILIELSEEYSEMAKERIEKATQQGRLF